MAQYSYKSISSAGVLLRGRLEARDVDAVKSHLQRQGYLLIESREISPGRIELRRKRQAGSKELAMATHELVMLLAAGQTVEQALQLLVEGAAPKNLRAAFAAALGHLRDGASITDALAATQSFPPIYLAMVQAGEASGALAEQLGKLAAMLERTAKLKDSLISAMIYPAVLVMVAIAAVILLLGLVVPQFAPLFANAPKQLPLVTSLVLAASTLLRDDGFLALAALSLLLIATAVALRRPNVADWCDDRLLRLPLVGGLLVLAATGRWMRVLAVLLKGGVPLPTALGLAAPVAGHRQLRAMIEGMRAGI